MPSICEHCSERERAADETEYEIEDLKKVEYMKPFEGEVFEGVISNITSFGMFVELENTVEGLVRLSDMHDDYYVYKENQYCLVGESTNKTFSIGDAIKVRLAFANIEARQIDFVLEKEQKRHRGETELQRPVLQRQEGNRRFKREAGGTAGGKDTGRAVGRVGSRSGGKDRGKAVGIKGPKSSSKTAKSGKPQKRAGIKQIGRASCRERV